MHCAAVDPLRMIRLMASRRRPHRLPREEYVGQKTVSYTLCVEPRVPLFTAARVVESFVAILGEEIAKHRCRVPVYCFMPDHLHLMVQGLEEDSDLLTPMDRLKLRGGILRGMLKLPGKLQSNYYDHIVRSSEDWRHQARYIALNPVRAGLADNPFDFRLPV